MAGFICVVVVGVLPTSVPASEPDKAYSKSTAPLVSGKDIETRAPSIIPKRLAIRDVWIDNAILGPSNGGNVSFTYTLDAPGFITIRAIREGTRELYLATILNFQYRTAGKHTEVWDGRDFYGNRLDYAKTPFTFRLQAESANASAPPPDHEKMMLKYEPGQPQSEVEADFERHVHIWHEEKYQNIPLLTINEPNAGQVVSGIVSIKSGVDKKRRGFGDKYGYGVRYYVDNEIVHEEFYAPESGGSFSYKLDTTAFEDGAHLFYVGMCDHNEHVTSHGIEVVINNHGR